MSHNHANRTSSQTPRTESGCGENHTPCGQHDPNYCETEHGRWVSVVKEFIRELNYGEVVLSVHAGRVVQVERTEKVRFT